MSALDAMKEAVYFQEPYIFLEQYIFYLKEGRDVRFPDREDEADIRLQWQGILSYLELEVTDRFLDRLASFWVVVVRQLEGKLSETSLDVIAERIKSVMFEQSDSISGDETEEEIWQKIGDIKESVRLQLSDEMKVARFYENNVTIDPLERIQLLDRAIRKKDANLFLETYLSIHLNGKHPPVPFSKVLDKISEEWGSIISGYSELRKPSPLFISLLEAKWFFLVNVLGVPLTVEAIRDMHYFIKLNPKKLNVKPENRNLFLKKTINLKRFQQGGKY